MNKTSEKTTQMAVRLERRVMPHIWVEVHPSSYESTLYRCVMCGVRHTEDRFNPHTKRPENGCAA